MTKPRKRKPSAPRRLVSGLDRFDRLLAVGAVTCAFGMFAVAAFQADGELCPARCQVHYQRFVQGKGRLTDAPVVKQAAAPTVRQMAASIPVAKEPPADPGADPVVLIPKEGPNPEIRKLTPAEKAMLPPGISEEEDGGWGDIYASLAMICEFRPCTKNKEGHLVIDDAARKKQDKIVQAAVQAREKSKKKN